MACSLSGQVMSSSSIRAFLRLFMARRPLTSPTGSTSPRACRMASRSPVTTAEGRASPENPVRVTEKTSVEGMSSRSRQKRATGTSPILSRMAGGFSLSRASGIRQGQMGQFLPEAGGGVRHHGGFQFIREPQGRGLLRGVQSAEHDHQPAARFEAQGLGQFRQGTAEFAVFRRFRRVKVAVAGIPGGVRVRQADVDVQGGGVIPVFQNVFRQAVRRFQINRGRVNAEQVRLFDGLRSGGAAVVRRAVRGEQEQGPALIVRLHYGGEQFPPPPCRTW